jgi:predicted TIM-barrel fold metal-dependent hydrolase
MPDRETFSSAGDELLRMSNRLPNRREFLTAAVKAITGASLISRRACSEIADLAQHTESTQKALIDAHTHFYDPTRPQGVPWPPADDKLLYRRVFPKDYRGLKVPRPVTGTVVVEASPWVEDNQWVLDLAANDSFIVGFVGNLPLGTKQFAGHLRRFAANKLFRGLRIRDRKLEGALDAPAFLADLKLLADRDLSLDLVGGTEILPFAQRLATEVPRLRIIVDHLAGVTIDGKAPPTEWVGQMRALSGRPSVYCKVSGLVEGTGRSDGSAPREVEFYRPVLDVMRTLFGPERLIYASNWPVSERFAPLGTVEGIILEYFASQGKAEAEQVLSKSAQAAYKWVRR